MFSASMILPAAMMVAFGASQQAGPMTRHAVSVPCVITSDPAAPADSIRVSVRLPDQPFPGSSYATVFTEIERVSRGSESGPTLALTREQWRPGQMVIVGHSPRMVMDEPQCFAELTWTTAGPSAWNGSVPREAPTRLVPGVAPSTARPIPQTARPASPAGPRVTGPAVRPSRPQ